MDLVKMIALTNAVKLLADNDIEVTNRFGDKPSEASIPTKLFLLMFDKYAKAPVSGRDDMYYLTAMYEGVLYRAIAYEYELKELKQNDNEAV